MKTVTFILLLPLLLAGCEKDRDLGPPKAVAVAQDGQLELRLMSYNVRHESTRDTGNRAWDQRIIGSVRMIRDELPDIIGFQEPKHGQLADLWASLPDYELVGVGRTDGARKGEYTAMLYRRDRFDLNLQGVLWLSDTPEVIGSTSWGNQSPRMVCWARFVDRASGRGFYAYNTHWDHRHQGSREKSALMIAEHIDQRAFSDEPVILLGDFNSTEQNRTLRFLTGKPTTLAGQERSWKSGLIDTYDALHPGERSRTTLHFWRGTRAGLLKVDHILVSRGAAILVSNIRDKDKPMISDHFPVTAHVRFPDTDP